MKLLQNKRFVLAAVSVGLSVTSAPQIATAQNGQFSIEEIVVTARKREESLQEVPVAISVFTGDGLEEAGIQTTRDLFANTPGLNYDTGFDQNAATPAIRGVVSNEIATYRQKVTTFLDGMPILGQQGSVPFNAIDQVEVLRGPQSAAFGRSTFGGAINYTTADPSDVMEGSLNLDLGENGLFNVNGTISGPIMGDTLGGLVSFAQNKRDGESHWVTEDEGFGLGGQESQNILAKLVYTPSDKMAIELRYKWLDVDNEQTPRDFYPWSNVDPVTGDSDPTDNRQVHPDSTAPGCGFGPPIACAYVGSISGWEPTYDYNYSSIGIDQPFVRNERDRYEAELTYDFDNGGTLQLMGFQSEEYYERATDADLFGLHLTSEGAACFPPALTDFDGDTLPDGCSSGFERDPTDIEETYFEIRYASSGDQAFRYSGGVSYYDYDFLTVVYRNVNDFLGGPTSGRQISEFATNTGYFFNLTYDLTDTLTGSIEGRYQNDEVGGNNISATETTSGQTSTKAFLPRVALTYTPTENTTFYAQVSKGNNPGGVNSGWFASEMQLAYDTFPEFFPASPNELAFFDEEEVLSTEIGVKGIIGGRATYALNVFNLAWENYTEIQRGLNFAPADYVDLDRNGVGDPGTPYDGMDFGASTFLGLGDVSGSGLEFESSIILTDNLRAGVAASFIDMTYDDGTCSFLPSNYGVPTDTTAVIGDSTIACHEIGGQEIGTQPKVQAALSLDYSKPLENGMEWFTRWSTQYTGSQYASLMNLAKLGAFSVSDLRTGIRADNWRAEAYVTNIFGEDAPQGLQLFFDGEADLLNPGPPTGRTNLVYTERRGTAFGLRLSYDFGG